MAKLLRIIRHLYHTQAVSTYLWLFSIAISRQLRPALSVKVMLAFLDNSSLTIST